MADHPKKSPRASVDRPLQEKGHLVQTATPVHPQDSVATTNVVMKNIEFSNHRLQVTNLPLHITPDQLNKYFAGNAGINVKQGVKKGAEAVVTFKTPEEFERAFLNSRKLSIDGRPLVVSPKIRTHYSSHPK